MKRVLKEKEIMNKDILKLNQLVTIVSRAHYLYKHLSKPSICRYTLVELLVKNFYLEGTLCWQNKEIDGERTYIEIEKRDGELLTLFFESGFTNFDLSFDVDIYSNYIYKTHLDKEIIDDVFFIIEDGHCLFIDRNNVISNDINYEGYTFENKIQIYSTVYITNRLLSLPRFI